MRESLAAALASDAYNVSRLTSLSTYKYDSRAQWDTVLAIEYQRTDEYFDLHVPGAEHYLAEGIYHHNTGKSFAGLWKMHLAALKYPGMHGLLLRKTLVSLKASTLRTYSERILGLNSPVKYRPSVGDEPAH